LPLLRFVSARILICGAARGSLGSPRPRMPVDFSSRPTIAIAPPSLRNVFAPRIQLSSRPFLFRVPSPPVSRPSPPESRHERTCLDFSPSSRLHALASTFPQGFPRPCVRCVLRFSQPLDAFLRARACRPISSCCHVQDSSRSGCSPLAQPPLLIGESVPPGRCSRRAHRRSDVRPSGPRLRGLHPRESALPVLRLFTDARARFPLQVFLLQVLPFPSCTRFTRVLRS
jgi:hypothetical protein